MIIAILIISIIAILGNFIMLIKLNEAESKMLDQEIRAKLLLIKIKEEERND